MEIQTRGIIRVSVPIVHEPPASCFICGAPYVEEDDCPLCRGCLQEEREQAADHRDWLRERRPL